MLNQNEKELLYRINSNADLRAVPERDIPELCRDIREFLVENVSHTGGHLASNLGSVELTVENDRLQSIRISCSGSVQVLLVEVQAALGADITFTQRSDVFSAAALNALK